MFDYTLSESQNIEYKSSWRDEYLKWICGFANAQGGRIYIGIDDNKEVVGLDEETAHRLSEEIPNKVRDLIGIIVDVNLLKKGEKICIEIVVEPCNVPISYKGQYHYRSGSTKQELKGVALQEFILKKMGKQWDDVAHETATLECIDPKAIRYFIRKGIAAGRISEESMDDSIEEVLSNLQFLTDDGKLKYAALLLFAKCPQKYFTGVSFRIGRFGVDETDLLFQDEIEGNILQMADRVLDVLKSKYLIMPIHYEGMQRIETLEIPEDAFREVLYNAIVHKQYSGAHIQMRVFNDHIELWNEGRLPDDFTIETLFNKHSSKPRNHNIAKAFYRAGFIESWGRGIKKICDGFTEAGFNAPRFRDHCGGVLVEIERNKTKMNDGKNVGKDVGKNITERQSVIIKLLKNEPSLSAKEMSERINVSDRTIERDLARLQQLGRLSREGGKTYGNWIVINDKEE